MTFPEKMHGWCPICGDQAKDMTTAPDGWVSRSTDSSDGYDLVFYEGEWMCPKCKRNKIQDRESLIAADKRLEEDEFRARAGFRRTMES